MQKKAVLFALMVTVLVFSGCFNSKVEKDIANGKTELITENINVAKKVKVAACEWEPYTGEKLQGRGFLTEVTVEGLRRAGYESQVIFYPWIRAFESVKDGENDALLGASFTKERLTFFEYPSVLWEAELCFYAPKGCGGRFVSPEKLAPAKIGIYNGSFLQEKLNGFPGLQLIGVNETGQNIEKLANGRLDYLIDSRDNVNFILQSRMKKYELEIEVMEPAFAKDEIYLVFSKKNSASQRLSEEFSKALQSMKLDGSYLRIAAKHGFVK